MILHKLLLTQLGGKMDPALRVAYRDVGKGREHGCGIFAPEKAPLVVARCSFGITKLRASRLDWRFFRGNNSNLISVTRP